MSHLEAVSAFVEGAPPGELSDVIAGTHDPLFAFQDVMELIFIGADIKSLTVSEPELVDQLAPAFQKYNEEQFATVKLPGSSQPVVISSHNSLGDGRYYDVESSSSFAFDHATQTASAVQSHVIEGEQADLVGHSGDKTENLTSGNRKSTLKSLGNYVNEHYPNAAFGVYPIESDSKIAAVIVANKYSPNNFWNGRWRSLYIFDPSSGSLEGSIKVDVHYYEDGNVRLLTDKPVTASIPSGTGAGIAKEISTAERKYQEELNKGFVSLSEGAFKGLRRQLPVTRQKIEWDKVTGYRLGQDIGGGSSRR
ncbi:F-actin-capping protein subunit alpha-like protein [Hapsidospora chrysogenum ATCC 11550]|uniref:F-actin-capping protein subunit alpha n=1 Tax=Hapsidospora chrysogenum (strain ATCC 11550 / CBS 779.69 / DSM 880 / IAM 14645 / JCM 23072 / IMI 49137) TaxID=857340 RepID=A0A086TAG4_HAPC1|nr:F-actin-capping protein subunit alpha-like protein [Hapsidospora chrysogenum ATCC 11550]